MPLSRKMRDYVVGKGGVADYAIYENRAKQNSFTEVFVFGSMEQYEGLDDEDETMRGFMASLESMLTDGKMRYQTLIEV